MRILAALAVLGLLTGSLAEAQTAPIPRLVIGTSEAPASIQSNFEPVLRGERTIAFDGAAWLQVRFSNISLGLGGTLTVVGQDRQSQRFSEALLRDWGGRTAMFNGSEITLTLEPGEGVEGQAVIEEIVVGLPPSDGAEGLDALRGAIGPSFERFRVQEIPTGARPEALDESICQPSDDRTASSNPLIGRIVPVGCTAWIVEGGALLTSGHCMGAGMQMVHFDVPPSQANGTIVAPPIASQYAVIAGSVVGEDTVSGNDWAKFHVSANTESLRTPIADRGGFVAVSNDATPDRIRITGFGLDGPPPNFGSGGASRNADSQTQQTHVGDSGQLILGAGGAASITYRVDTQPGNSGGPILSEDAGGNLSVGIHENGGCGSASSTANNGTSFRNDRLWSSVQQAIGGTAMPLVLPQRTDGELVFFSGEPNLIQAVSAAFPADAINTIVMNGGQVVHNVITAANPPAAAPWVAFCEPGSSVLLTVLAMRRLPSGGFAAMTGDRYWGICRDRE